MTAVSPVTVEVFSDVICPWCYIGSRRLADGIAHFTAEPGPAGPAPVEVIWHPFELNPDMPANGKDRREYRSAKFGSWAHSHELDEQVALAGRSEGLDFRHDLMARTPNTRAAHRLIWHAQQLGLGPRMAERLFTAYFTEGLDVGDKTVLAELAVDVGVPAGDAAAVITGTGPLGHKAEDAVTAGIARGRAVRVSGVPFFVFGGAYTLPAGAQPAETIAQVLRVVRQDQHQQQLAAAAAASPSVPSARRDEEGSVVGSCSVDGTC